MFTRLYFVENFEQELEAGAGKLMHLAGHYYHVAEDQAKELVERGIARLEGHEHDAPPVPETEPPAAAGGEESEPSAVADEDRYLPRDLQARS